MKNKNEDQEVRKSTVVTVCKLAAIEYIVAIAICDALSFVLAEFGVSTSIATAIGILINIPIAYHVANLILKIDD